MRSRWAGLAGLLALFVFVSLMSSVAVPGTRADAAGVPRPGAVIAPNQRAGLLPKGWQRSSDVAWTTEGDQYGFHLFSATEASGYAWRTVASLSEPGIETDRWIGNVCLTESGRHAVVVYGPRAFTNRQELFDRGGFVAVVDMDTGHVRKVPLRASLAYFDPGCGAGEQAVVTQVRGEGDPTAQTRLMRLDVGHATVVGAATLPGQITSAVPVAGGTLVAAAGRQLVSIDHAGRLHKIASAASIPYRITADAGGVDYMEQAAGTAHVQHIADLTRRGSATELARGPLTAIDLVPTVRRRAFILGQAQLRSPLPSTVRGIATPSTSEVSEQGRLALLPGVRPSSGPGRKGAADPSSQWSASLTDPPAPAPGEPAAVQLNARVLTTGKNVNFTITPGVRGLPRLGEGATPHPLNTPHPLHTARPVAPKAAAAGSPTSPVDDDAYCAVPRNDAKTQVYQPTPRQVEWAADQAVVGKLTLTRPANWKVDGLPSYPPQGLFPPVPLSGGGRVPVQILLGVMAQESNLWQASGHSLSGVPGNPLVGNFYGRNVSNASGDDDWDIIWSNSDCGYGLTQVTDGMRKAAFSRPNEVALSPTLQRAAALDYTANISAGLQILQAKWNRLKALGITMGNGDPQWLENWFFAIWAYNSGVQPDATHGNTNGCSPGPACTDAKGNWGLGWGNNPVNPNFPPGRGFFNADPHDPAHPQDWPYPEKVIGFAAYSISTPDGPGFRPSWWVSNTDRDAARPPVTAFCTVAANHCDPSARFVPNDPDVVGEPAGPCGNTNTAGKYDLHCWWHQAATYHGCDTGHCGHELLRFDETFAEQPDGTHTPPVCDLHGLPSGVQIIDDVADSVQPVRRNNDGSACGHPWTNAGTFSLTFAGTSPTCCTSKIDFHQLGAGFGGHFWFAHTWKPGDLGGNFKVTGRWAFSASMTGWGRVLVHMPEVGAQTQQARYDIDPGNGIVKSRYALQQVAANKWVSLGIVQLKGRPSITLSNQTWDGRDSDDIAWDAVAIQPLPAKPRDFVVALGDSYSSGEGANDPTNGDDYYKETDVNGGLPNDMGRNACHRSPNAWPRQGQLADDVRFLGARADALDNNLDFQFHACSGARTGNLLPFHSTSDGTPAKNAFGVPASGQYGEVSQLDAGYLDENTTLVTLSIGGNDARFADVVQQCVFGAGQFPCPDTMLSGESQNMRLSVPGHIRGEVRESLLQVLRAIHDRAPNAKIVLMGYPRLLENNGNCVVGIQGDEAPWINDMADVMNGMENETVSSAKIEGLPVWFANPTDVFTGRGICGSPESINNIVTNKTAGDNGSVSAQSFHPNIAGHELYAIALQSALAAAGQ